MKICILLVLWISCVWGIHSPLPYYQEADQKVPLKDATHRLKDLAMKEQAMSDYKSYALQGRRFWKFINKGFNKIKDVVEKPVKGVIHDVKEKTQNVIGKVKDTAQNVIGKVKETSHKVVSKVKDTAQNVIAKVKESIQKVIGKVKEMAQKVIGHFTDTEKAVKTPTSVLDVVDDPSRIVNNVFNVMKCLNTDDKLNVTLRFDKNNYNTLNAQIDEINENEEIIHDEVDYIIDSAIYVRDKMDKVITLQGRLRFG